MSGSFSLFGSFPERTRRSRIVESRGGCGAAQHSLGDVVVQKRRAVAGRKHVGTGGEAGAAFLFA
jgi:hypothetical protein